MVQTPQDCSSNKKKSPLKQEQHHLKDIASSELPRVPATTWTATTEMEKKKKKKKRKKTATSMQALFVYSCNGATAVHTAPAALMAHHPHHMLPAAAAAAAASASALPPY